MSTKPVANFEPLSPVNFMRRAGQFLAGRPAIVCGNAVTTYGQLARRIGDLASALSNAGVGTGDCVAIMAPNVPPMIEAHYAIPYTGATICPLSLKLDANAIANCLRHANIRLAICDERFVTSMIEAIESAGLGTRLIVISNSGHATKTYAVGEDYERFLSGSEGAVAVPNIEDETQPLSLLFTSGTTARPKAVTYSHRGAYVAAVSNALSFGLNNKSVFLWTWPMFHSHGLSFIWAVAAAGGTHVCLREVDERGILDAIHLHGVSHFCVVPTVMNALAGQLAADGGTQVTNTRLQRKTRCIVGGAAPSASSIAVLEDSGIEVVHQYGSTECYGPVTVCLRDKPWKDMSVEERDALTSRQGVPAVAVADLRVADLDTLKPVPKDGQTCGEVLVRGNAVMQAYFADEGATDAALANGWYRTGDIAAWHPDGSIEIRDRSTDLITSGGRRVSSVEIDDILHAHPAVQDAAVVGKPDPVSGEVPYAFVTLQADKSVDASELESFCRTRLADHKVPRGFEFGELPRTATGKIRKSELRKRIAGR